MTVNCANPAPEYAGCSRARTAIFRLGRIFVAVEEIADLDYRKPEGRVGKAAQSPRIDRCHSEWQGHLFEDDQSADI
ncbi:hypothetical protein N183_23710 [Sinorhizobium sp. Sb3]|uniref:hypothetical protein n=1 Tax=Ensifer sp. 22564 TaxID=3453943 RepID=UPI00071E1B40|nr:hypothetical protein N183_23710 [Sinorhizobium sp. Sb3]